MCEGQIQPKSCFNQFNVLYLLVIRRWLGALSTLATVLMTFWSQWQRSLELLFILLHLLQIRHGYSWLFLLVTSLIVIFRLHLNQLLNFCRVFKL